MHGAKVKIMRCIKSINPLLHEVRLNI